MSLYYLAVFLISFFISAPSFAQSPKKPAPLPTLIVFDIVPEKGVESTEANLLTEIVLDKIAQLRAYTVIGQKDLDKLLSWEQSKQLKGCNDTSCLVQIAGAMGASYYVEGSVGVMGDNYILTIKLIDTASIIVLDRTTQKIPKDENKIVMAVERIIDKMMAGHVEQLKVAAKSKKGTEVIPERPNLIVFDMVAEKGVGKSESNLLTELVLDNVARTQRYNVMGQKDLDKMMDWEQSKQLKGCTGTSCMVQIANAMAAGHYIEGSIGVMGDNYIISIKLIDAGKVVVVERSTFKVVRDENAIVEAVDNIVKMILFKSKERLSSDEKEAAVVRQQGSSPGIPPEPPKAAPANPQPTGVSVSAAPEVSAQPVSRLLGKIGVFGGAGLVAFGGLSSVLQKQSVDSYRKQTDPKAMKDGRDRADLYRGLALGGYIGGGAIAATGAVLWIVSSTSARVAVVPAVNRDGVGFAFAGAW